MDFTENQLFKNAEPKFNKISNTTSISADR